LYKDVPCVTISESNKKDLQKHGFNEVYTFPMGIDFKPIEKIGEKEMKFKRKKPSKTTNKEISWGTPKVYQVKPEIETIREHVEGEVLEDQRREHENGRKM